MGILASRIAEERDVRHLAERTYYTKKQIREWRRTFLSDFPKGYFLFEEFKDLCYKFQKTRDLAPYFKFLFHALDLNKDEKIHFIEFVTIMGVSSHGSLDDKLNVAFRIFDINGNGYITQEELEKMALCAQHVDVDSTQSGMAVVLAQVDDAFTRVDLDKDGRISEEEFYEAAKGMTPFVKALTVDVVSTSI